MVPDYSFLASSEAGLFIQKKDWSSHELGSPTQWNPFLLNALNFILESGFPMFLYWGPNYICFYNDAFAPTFSGKGNDYDGIGKPLTSVFPEAYENIDALISHIRKTGKSDLFEDVPTKLKRGETMVETYWTYSYSPVRNFKGEVLGVLAVCMETTEKVNAYRLAVSSEAKFRNIFLGAHIGILIIRGEERKIEFANDLYLSIVGRDRSCLGKQVWDVLPEVKDQGFDTILEDVFRTGVAYRSSGQEIRLMRNKKMETGYYTFSFEAVQEGQAGVDAVMVIVTDVTEQVKMRKEAELTEIRLRQAVEATQLGTYDFNLLTEELVGTERFYRIFGFVYPANHSAIVEVIHPDDRRVRDAAHRKAYATGYLYYESRVIWKSGPTRWIKAMGNVIYDHERTPIRILGSVLDITEEKETREKLVQTAERLELALRAGRLGSYELDLLTEKILCTDQCKANFGLAPDDSLNLSRLLSLVVEEDRDIIRTALAEAIKNSSQYAAEYRVQWPDGSIHWIQASGLTVPGKEGGVVKVTGVTVEISSPRLPGKSKKPSGPPLLLP